MWMRGCPVHTAAANEGLLSCEWEVVPFTRQPLMRGYYHVNERLSRSHGSHWWGAGILWMSEELSDCALQTAERCSEAGAACLHSGFFRAASTATWGPFAPASALGSPHHHGRGAWEAGLMSCPAGSTVRGMRTFSRHELITWVPKVHRWSEGRRTTFKKCHTHLNAAEEQPWGLPSNERTLTVSCNSLSHNLGSAKWRKRFWRNCRGRRIYTASRARICMLRNNWPVIWTGVSQ